MNENVLRPSLSTTIQSWVLAVRPKTLTASIVPFAAGTAYAASQGFEIHWILFMYALLSALCIQIATNFINDAFDFKRGADNDDRLGPKRAVQNGVATPEQMYTAGLSVFFMAFVFAIPLIFFGGWFVAVVVLASIMSGYAYTGGAKPLAYSGLGDAFVIIFFGWVSTAAAYWLHAGTLDWTVFLLGTQIGLLCTVLIAINNLRDIHGDALVGKQTLAVRYGMLFARVEISFLSFFPFILTVLWFFDEQYYAGLLSCLAIPLAVRISYKIWNTQPSQAYNGYLGLGALLHILFATLLSIGFLIK